MCILEGVHFGQHYFQAAKMLTNSMIISVLTHNCEVLYNVTQKDIQIAESFDHQLIRKICHLSRASVSIMMLEMGLWPLRFVIKICLLYLHHILTRDENSLIRQALEQLLISPVRTGQCWSKKISMIRKSHCYFNKYNQNLNLPSKNW